MTLPAPIAGGLLASVLDIWQSRGWNLRDLDRFRMGPEDDGLEDLSDDEVTALESLSDDDVDALSKLTAEQLAELATGGGDDVDEDGLPDPVKAVLKKERGNARNSRKAQKTAEREAHEAKARAEKAEAELAKLKKKPPAKTGDDEVDAEEIRRLANEEATKTANRRILGAEIRAAAASKLSSPDLAERLLDLDDFEVKTDGTVDRKAIADAIDELLEDNPGLAAKARRRAPKPNAGQGRKTGGSTGADAGRAEAERRFGKREAAATAAK